MERDIPTASTTSLEDLEVAFLNKPTDPRPTAGYVPAAPRNELEQTIAAVWHMLLSVEQLGIHDNFFELGGDSLLAVQVVDQLQADLQIQLPHDSLLSAPTVATMALLVIQQFIEQTDSATLVQLLITIEQVLENNAQEDPSPSRFSST